jgi:hypothetical protein
MNILARIWKLFFPPSRWSRCQPMTEFERLAAWELRTGQHRAEKRMRAARVAQAIDEYTSSTVRPYIAPKLPVENVIAIRRRKRAA